MSIIISRVIDGGNDAPSHYVVEVGGSIVAEFDHRRSHRIASCLRSAADAIEPAATPHAREGWTYGHCEQKKKPGGCPLHNLHCGYPDCDRKPLPPSPAPGQEA